MKTSHKVVFYVSGWDKRGKDHHQVAVTIYFQLISGVTLLIMTTMIIVMVMFFFLHNDDHEERGPTGRPDPGYSDEMLSTGSTITATNVLAAKRVRHANQLTHKTTLIFCHKLQKS